MLCALTWIKEDLLLCEEGRGPESWWGESRAPTGLEDTEQLPHHRAKTEKCAQEPGELCHRVAHVWVLLIASSLRCWFSSLPGAVALYEEEDSLVSYDLGPLSKRDKSAKGSRHWLGLSVLLAAAVELEGRGRIRPEWPQLPADPGKPTGSLARTERRLKSQKLLTCPRPWRARFLWRESPHAETLHEQWPWCPPWYSSKQRPVPHLPGLPERRSDHWEWTQLLSLPHPAVLGGSPGHLPLSCLPPALPWQGHQEEQPVMSHDWFCEESSQHRGHEEMAERESSAWEAQAGSEPVLWEGPGAAVSPVQGLLWTPRSAPGTRGASCPSHRRKLKSYIQPLTKQLEDAEKVLEMQVSKSFELVWKVENQRSELRSEVEHI